MSEMVLVPKTPTREMLDASDPHYGSVSGPYGDDRYYLSDEQIAAIWSLMVRAALAQQDKGT